MTQLLQFKIRDKLAGLSQIQPTKANKRKIKYGI